MTFVTAEWILSVNSGDLAKSAKYHININLHNNLDEGPKA